jgi:hypothetical protein
MTRLHGYTDPSQSIESRVLPALQETYPFLTSATASSRNADKQPFPIIVRHKQGIHHVYTDTNPAYLLAPESLLTAIEPTTNDA